MVHTFPDRVPERQELLGVGTVNIGIEAMEGDTAVPDIPIDVI